MMKSKKYLKQILFACQLVLFSAYLSAFAEVNCRTINIDEIEFTGSKEFSNGLLWKVSRSEQAPSYLFGTIHVAAEEVGNIPDHVNDALSKTDVFVMEALPEPSDVILFANLMFFNNGNQLNNLVSEPIFNRTVEILSAYNMPSQAVTMMKPWAAFLTMSYPADMGVIMDLQLLKAAQAKGSEVYGLETLQEQGDIFNDMVMDDQVRLLTDTVCHYDLIKNDFAEMKSLYMQRDLKGLYQYGQRYSFDNNQLYEKLTSRLLTERNYRMVERMESILKNGKAFIAIGAMHLAGNEGVLALLSKQEYKISRIY